MQETYYCDHLHSKHPQENPGEQHIHYIINQTVLASIKLSDIITESTKNGKINETIKLQEIKQ